MSESHFFFAGLALLCALLCMHPFRESALGIRVIAVTASLSFISFGVAILLLTYKLYAEGSAPGLSKHMGSISIESNPILSTMSTLFSTLCGVTLLVVGIHLFFVALNRDKNGP